MALPDRRLDGARLWRLDLAVLADDAAKEILRAGVSGTFSGARDPSQEWDTLKAQWQHWAKECGRNVRLRITHELNETLRKIRIVKAGAPLTPTTREFLGVLRARYDRIFLQTTQKVHIYPQDSMFQDTPDLTRFLKSRRSLNGPNEYAMSVCMRDGSVSEEGTDIDRCFLEYFSHLFAESDQVTDSSAVIRELESLCAGVPKLPEEASANLTKKASAAEVFSILRSLKVGSAPGPDGLPTEFYKELWPEIGAGLVAMINGILNSGKVPESLAEGKLILLPKEGPLRRVLVPRALGNLCPSAERTPPHYKALVALFRELTAMDPDLDPREVAPARLCEQLVSARGTLRSPPPTFPWLELTSGKVPKEMDLYSLLTVALLLAVPVTPQSVHPSRVNDYVDEILEDKLPVQLRSPFRVPAFTRDVSHDSHYGSVLFQSTNVSKHDRMKRWVDCNSSVAEFPDRVTISCDVRSDPHKQKLAWGYEKVAKDIVQQGLGFPCARDADCLSGRGLTCQEWVCACAPSSPVKVQVQGIDTCLPAKALYESCRYHEECSHRSSNMRCVDFLCYCPLPFELRGNGDCLAREDKKNPTVVASRRLEQKSMSSSYSTSSKVPTTSICVRSGPLKTLRPKKPNSTLSKNRTSAPSPSFPLDAPASRATRPVATGRLLSGTHKHDHGDEDVQLHASGAFRKVVPDAGEVVRTFYGAGRSLRGCRQRVS
ncbi:hypothetical protein MTO96_027427 [Rhipicephalus appendiculatus]